MIITLPWLKEHLKTKANEKEIIERLTNIGLEVEAIKENSDELSKFKIAKIVKVEKHPLMIIPTLFAAILTVIIFFYIEPIKNLTNLITSS